MTLVALRNVSDISCQTLRYTVVLCSTRLVLEEYFVVRSSTGVVF